ncbi:ABC transporter permease [Candidatus Hydrogenedentota bacterium]
MRSESSISIRLFSATTTAVFAAIVLLPLAYAVVVSLKPNDAYSLSAYTTLFTTARQWRLLGNSIAVGMGTALVATLLGAVAGLGLEYIRVPSRSILIFSLAIPFLIPDYISAMAWVDLLGNNGFLREICASWLGIAKILPDLYSIPGVILVQSMTLFPIAALTTGLAAHRLDARFEEAALLVHGRWSTFFAVTLPLLTPGMLTGALCVFVLSVTSFAVPSLFQVEVYPVEIYARFSAFYDFAGAVVQSLPLTLAGILVFVLWARYLHPKREWLKGWRRHSSASCQGRKTKLAATAFCWCLVTVSAGLPLATIVWRSFPLSTYISAWRTARGEILNSVILASLSASILLVLSFSMACLAREKRTRSWLYRLSLLPFLVSGPVFGIGLILAWNHSGMRAIVYDSLAVLLFACVGRFLLFTYFGLSANLAEVHPSLEEVAAVSGVPWIKRVTGLLIPLTRPTLVAVWGIGFVLCLGEIDASVLVCPPGFSTVSVRLYTLMHYGPSSTVAALSVITVALVLTMAAVTAGGYLKMRKAFHERR